MLEGIALFLVGVGALLVSVASMLRLAWLAILLPLGIAVGAAFGIYWLGTRRARRLPRRERDKPRPKSPRVAA